MPRIRTIWSLSLSMRARTPHRVQQPRHMVLATRWAGLGCNSPCSSTRYSTASELPWMGSRVGLPELPVAMPLATCLRVSL
ncbi:hypothetical protein D3C71_1692450 [compost metagenome]